MREQIEERLKELKGEFEDGQRMLDELEAKQISLRNTLLRISGAMQVLEELLSSQPVEVSASSPAQLNGV
jgi:predicted nuclease with TOPRIM domain